MLDQEPLHAERRSTALRPRRAARRGLRLGAWWRNRSYTPESDWGLPHPSGHRLGRVSREPGPTTPKMAPVERPRPPPPLSIGRPALGPVLSVFALGTS